MPLYEVAIVLRSTKKEVEEGAPEETLVFGPKPVVARDPQLAGMLVMSQNTHPIAEINLDRAQVLIRPFA